MPRIFPATRPARRGAALAAAAAVLLAACAPDATEPTLARAPAPAALRVAAAAAVAPQPVHFLPPLAPQPTYTGAFDGALLDRLTVEVCALNAAATACAAEPLLRATATTGGPTYSEKIRLVAAREMYLVYWNAAAPAVSPETHYRARVLLDGAELGKLDVDVVRTSTELAGVDRSRFVGVVLGSWAPVAFRVERPAAPVPTVTSAFVDAVAQGLYAAVASGVGREAAIRDALGAFVRIVGPAEAGQLETLHAQGVPLVLEEQIAGLSRAFAEGDLLEVDRFAAAATQAGATAQAGGAVTRAVLTQALQPVLARTEHGPETAVSAFVMALGRERARRAGVAIDPVWGDGKLDPLQKLLLLYAIQFSRGDGASLVAAVAPAVSMRATSADVGATAALADLQFPKWSTAGGPFSVRGLVTGAIGKAIEMPLTPTQAVGSSVCASILLYGHQFQLFTTARELERRHARATKPGQTEITATLTFDFTPNELAKKWLALPLVGCTIPPSGAASGKSVRWTVNAPLTDHGAITASQAATDATGRARATYLTVGEPVPVLLQQNQLQKSATGTVDVRATGLVPGWSNLERAVGVGVLNPTDAGVRLNVLYYEFPKLAFSMESRFVFADLFDGTYTSTMRAATTLLPTPTGTYLAEDAKLSRDVLFTPRDECPDAITSMSAPYVYPVGVNANAESIGGLLVYVNPPHWEESWRHGTRLFNTCEWTTHTAGNYAGVGWVTTHEEEIAEDGWPMGGRFWVARLGGWTNPSPGLFRRTYDRRRLGITEQSTLELRVVAP